MNESNPGGSSKSRRKELEVRPPVIGQEHTSNDEQESSHSMNPNPDTRPPALPPRPRVGSGVPSQKGPPPPVTPRRSSLLTNHLNSANGSQEPTNDKIGQNSVPNVGLLGTDNINQNSVHNAGLLKIDENANPPSIGAVNTLKCDTKNCEDNSALPSLSPRLEPVQESEGKKIVKTTL